MLGEEPGCNAQQQDPCERVSFPPAGRLPSAAVQPHLPSPGGPDHPPGAHPPSDVGCHGTQPSPAGSESPGRCRVSGQHGQQWWLGVYLDGRLMGSMPGLGRMLIELNNSEI